MRVKTMLSVCWGVQRSLHLRYSRFRTPSWFIRFGYVRCQPPGFQMPWKPGGWQRTYPNLMNHEGVLNLEYLKWSDLCTPQHTLNMVFTRMLSGPMDYHLGGFRSEE